MSRDKQIEEMANDLAKICPDLVENCCGQINCVTHLTLSLSKIGYRKASDVVREVIDHIDGWFMYCEKYSGNVIKLRLAELKKKYESEGEG